MSSVATEGITVVSAMHDLTLAARFADRIALLVDGQLVADGRRATVLRPTCWSGTTACAVHVMRGPNGELIVPPARRWRRAP